jgi:hypothetical protein
MYSHAGFLNRSKGQNVTASALEAQFAPFWRICAILGASVVTILLVCIKDIKKTTNRPFLSTNGKRSTLCPGLEMGLSILC